MAHFRCSEQKHRKKQTQLRHPVGEVNVLRRKRQSCRRRGRSHRDCRRSCRERSGGFDRGRAELTRRTSGKARAGQNNRPGESSGRRYVHRGRSRCPRRRDRHLTGTHCRKEPRLNGEANWGRTGTRVEAGVSAVAGGDCVSARVEGEDTVRGGSIALTIQRKGTGTDYWACLIEERDASGWDTET